MINQPFTTVQMETVYTLFLNKRTEPQIMQATGYSRSLIRRIMQDSKGRFASRLFQRQKRLQAHSRHRLRHTDYANALREALGKEPLYEEHLQHCAHTQDKIEHARAKQSQRVKASVPREMSILESLVGDELFS